MKSQIVKKGTVLFLMSMVIAITYLNAQKNSGLTLERSKNERAPNKFETNGFIIIKGPDEKEYRVYAAGPPEAAVGILVVHDYFGITNATKESVERLGALGYRTIAVDLYKGKSATTNDSAEFLMNGKDSSETARILQAGIKYLQKPGRKLAAIGFSAGGIDAMNATLMEPELFKATIIVYGGNYDKIDKSRLAKLHNSVLAITGSLDKWPMQAALDFLENEKDKSLEFHVYPGADHGYAQPLFNEGKNYNVEATRVTWMLIDDFLFRNISKNPKG